MKSILGLLVAALVVVAATAAAVGRADLYSINEAETGFAYNSGNHVLFTEINSTHVLVQVRVTGLVTRPNGLHGIHVHEFGDVSDPLASGAHWNPFNSPTHACETNTTGTRHAGDMGNWEVVDGEINQDKELDLLALTGSASIIGRSVVIHAQEDNCEVVASSGTRLAAGVIGVANEGGNTAAPGGFTSPYFVVCNIRPTTTGAAKDLAGQFYWEQDSNDNDVRATGWLSVNATVGVHIHTYGDLSANDGMATAGHWDPSGTSKHDFPNATQEHHQGDMGNTDPERIAEGLMWYINTFDDTRMTIQEGARSIVGRGFIVHADFDHGDDGTATGSAGARDGQCVIGIASPSVTKVKFYPEEQPVEAPQAETPPAPTGSASSFVISFGLVACASLLALFL